MVFVASCAARPKGVYHRVKKGETLWRIAKTYNADIDTLVETNNLPSKEAVEEGTIIFIPGATGAVKVILPVPEKKPVTETVQKKPVTVTAEKKTEPVEEVKKTYKSGFVWPLKGKVSSKFGVQPDGMRVNNGIKIDAKEGALVKASEAGTVILSGPLKYYGETVIIKHSSSLRTVYSNLSKRMVEEGHVVEKGQQIALLGREEKSGRECLYFEIRYKNRAKDPLTYLH